jgi:predicted nucleic acid-binding protein
MMGRVAKYALLDAGFWIAMLDSTDAHHAAANRLYTSTLEPLWVVTPWPCFYEFLRTMFVKHPHKVSALSRALKRPGVMRFKDEPYRERALEQCLEPHAWKRPLSLVDRVLRAYVDDRSNRVDYVVTVDPEDFDDVCRSRKAELLDVKRA